MTQPQPTTDHRPPTTDLHTALVLLVALAVRLLAWRILPYRDWISDEAEYWGAATWLANGRGFSFFDGWVWSRPPLYLAFLAAQIKVFGPTAFWAPRLSQTLLSVVAVWLVMRIARRLAPVGSERRVALLAGWAMALAYSFATFAYLLLSETLFLVLFLGGVLALLRWERGAGSGSQGSGFVSRSSTTDHRFLILAGLLFGAAALTRAVVLTWLPLVALWVLWQGQTSKRGIGDRGSAIKAHFRSLIPDRRSLAAVLVLTVAVCMVVLPWTAWATARWGGGSGLIVVDTTGGYNFALGAQTGLVGGRDEVKLHDLLCGGAVCDNGQAARQSAAYAQGWRWIGENPLGFIRKTGRELLDMVQLRFGGAERMTSGYTAGTVSLSHLVGLLLDDTLYALAAGLAMLGLARQQARAGKGLVISWLLYNVAIGALVFAINRFRQPLLPFVFIYAACALVQWREAWPSRGRRRVAWGLAGVVWLLIAPSYFFWPNALENGRRAVLQDAFYTVRGLGIAAECREIERVLAAGEVARARTLHDAMNARYPPPGLDCLAIINAKLLPAEGKNQAALAFMAESSPKSSDVQAAKILLLEGDLLRRLGRWNDALGRFAAREVEAVNDTAWAWDNLAPPITTTLDVGTGLDYGYVRGFYKREDWQTATSFRWSSAESALKFPNAGTGAPQTLRLRVNGYTNDWRPTTITPRFGGQDLTSLTLQPEWQTVEIVLPPTPLGADVVVEFGSTVFVDGPQDLANRQRSPTSQPLRLLGFQLDWAQIMSDE